MGSPSWRARRQRNRAILYGVVSCLMVLVFWFVQRSSLPQQVAGGGLWVIRFVSGRVSGMTGTAANWFDMAEQNQRLKRQIAQFTLQLQMFEELAEENKRLKKLVAYHPPPPFKRITASVIARSPDTWHRQILVGVGSRDGVQEGSPVSTEAGLVGRAVKVTAGTAVVRLISDPLSAVSVTDSRSRDVGIINGRYEAQAGLEYLRQHADIRPGDLLVTSGLGRFPKGLPVGIVQDVERRADRMNPEILVALLADLNRLEEVFVLVEAP